MKFIHTHLKDIKAAADLDAQYDVKQYVLNPEIANVVSQLGSDSERQLLKYKLSMVRIMNWEIIPMGLIGLFLLFLGIPWTHWWLVKMNYTHAIWGVGVALILCFIVSLIIYFYTDRKYITKRFKMKHDLFEGLIKDGYLDTDMSKYPVLVQMSDYSDPDMHSKWTADNHPHFTDFSYYQAYLGLCIFFDKLNKAYPSQN